MKKAIIVIGAGQRGAFAYVPYALDNGDQLQVVGVAEPVDVKREYMRKTYGIAEENCYTTWETCLERDKFADAVLISTQDRLHFEPAMKAIEKGYDILLEKPMSPLPEECVQIRDAAQNAGVKVLVCHVLRYTSHYQKMKEIVDSGRLGDIVHIVHTENVGDYHHAHSYVRGNWNNSETSAPMILAKSCHDVDLLRWIIGKKCKKVSAFGSLKYFHEGHKPEGAPKRCIEGCPHGEVCPYNAVKSYYEDKNNRWFRTVAADCPDPTDEQVLEAIKTGPYGRCVFQCDNNVVDHMVVNMEFEDEVTAAFTMSAFSPRIARESIIMGTKGHLRSDMEKEEIIVTDFLTRTEEVISTKNDLFGHTGHGGGDEGIIRDFIDVLNGEEITDRVTGVEISCESHMIAFAAEEARLTGKVIDMDEYYQEMNGGKA